MNEDRLWSALEERLPQAYGLRHELHRRPEISGKESATRDAVLEALPPATEKISVAGTGAVMRLGGPGPAVGLRGELDALPVTEATQIPWSSSHPGVMHACGHDVHLAALTAVMHALHDAGASTPALAVLQPREETYPSGAEDIARASVLEAQDCRYMIGAHVQPVLDQGVVACVAGGVNAASDEFVIEIQGEPGHAAYPHLTVDPVLTASHIIIALHSVISRSVDPIRSAVLGVSTIKAGEAANVVPETARLSGILRALDEETRQVLRQQLEQIAKSVAAALGCRASVRVTTGEPVLFNDPQLVRATQLQLQERGIEVSETLRSLGADDFAFFAERVPSLMLFVGTATNERLHSSTFLPENDDLRVVAKSLMAGYVAAARSLASNSTAYSTTQNGLIPHSAEFHLS